MWFSLALLPLLVHVAQSADCTADELATIVLPANGITVAACEQHYTDIATVDCTDAANSRTFAESVTAEKTAKCQTRAECVGGYTGACDATCKHLWVTTLPNFGAADAPGTCAGWGLYAGDTCAAGTDACPAACTADDNATLDTLPANSLTLANCVKHYTDLGAATTCVDIAEDGTVTTFAAKATTESTAKCGSAADQDCSGGFTGTCSADCKKAYAVTVPSVGAGTCAGVGTFEDAVTDCGHGTGACVVAGENCIGGLTGTCNAECKRAWVTTTAAGAGGTCVGEGTVEDTAGDCVHGEDLCLKTNANCVGGFTGACDANCKHMWVSTTDEAGTGTCTEKDTVEAEATCTHGEGACLLANGNCVGAFTGACNADCKHLWVTATAAAGTGTCAEATTYGGETCADNTDECNRACVGAYGVCDKACKKAFAVTAAKTGTGAACEAADAATADCKAADAADDACKPAESSAGRSSYYVATAVGMLLFALF